MVTTTTGTIEFTSVKNPNKKYSLSAFVDDVTATFLPINLNGLAVTAGLNFWTTPEDVYVSDMSFITGPTVIKVVVPFVDDGLVPGKVTQFANTVNTIQTRKWAALTIAAGHKVQFQAI
jgi:hypothetical protein